MNELVRRRSGLLLVLLLACGRVSTAARQPTLDAATGTPAKAVDGPLKAGKVVSTKVSSDVTESSIASVEHCLLQQQFYVN